MLCLTRVPTHWCILLTKCSWVSVNKIYLLFLWKRDGSSSVFLGFVIGNDKLALQEQIQLLLFNFGLEAFVLYQDLTQQLAGRRES